MKEKQLHQIYPYNLVKLELDDTCTCGDPVHYSTENEILFLDPAPVHFESMRYTSYSPKTEGGGYIHPALDVLLF